MLPAVTDSESVELEDKLKLEFYKLEQTFKGDITLNPTIDETTLENPKSLKVGGMKTEEDETLESLISKVNDKFSGIFTDTDKVIVETLYNKCIKDNKKLQQQAKKNDEEVFNKSIFPEIFKQVSQDCYMEQMKAFGKLFEDKAFYEIVMQALAEEAYKDLRSKKDTDK